MTLETDTAGNQLQEASDVKVRGVIVGEVREVEAERRAAPPSSWRIDPEYLDQIPADVTARLLPKTLFGERFVSLELPGRAVAQERLGRRRRHRPGPQRERHRAAAGASTTCCRCCRPSQPQDLAYTLGAVADAAARPRRRPRRQPRRRPASYFGEINTVLPELQAGHLAARRLRRHLRRRGRRPAGRPGQPRGHQHARSSTRPSSCGGRSPSAQRRSNTTAGFLETNERNLISLAETSRPVLGALRRVLADVPLPARGAGPVATR